MKKITSERKIELESLIDAIYKEYNLSIPVDLKKIATAQKIYFGYKEFESNFDGILTYWDNQFYIIINNANTSQQDSNRIRFTFAHELGHYFIDEHRNKLIEESICFVSQSKYTEKDLKIEKEADFFAASLLMPKEIMKSSCKESFSPSLIETIAAKFQTSILATLIRYIELDLYPLFIVYIKNKLVTGYRYSKDFPYIYKDLRNKKVPSKSVFHKLNNDEFTSIEPEEIEIDLWFKYKKENEFIEEDEEDESHDLLEYCYKINDSLTINIVWEES